MLRFCAAALTLIGILFLAIGVWKIFTGQPHFEDKATGFLMLIYAALIQIVDNGSK
jgi:predicted membrane protein